MRHFFAKIFLCICVKYVEAAICGACNCQCNCNTGIAPVSQLQSPFATSVAAGTGMTETPITSGTGTTATGNQPTTETVTVTTTTSSAPEFPKTVETTATDDAVQVDENVHTDLSLLEIGKNVMGYHMLACMKFDLDCCDAGTTIEQAYLKFTNKQQRDANELPDLKIYGEFRAVQGFQDTLDDLSSRPRSKAEASWNPSGEGVEWEKGRKVESPNIAPILNEIVESDFHQKGDSTVLCVEVNDLGPETPDKSIAVNSREAGEDQAPKLHYTITKNTVK